MKLIAFLPSYMHISESPKICVHIWKRAENIENLGTIEFHAVFCQKQWNITGSIVT